MKFGVEVLQRKLEKENKVGVVILSRYSSSRLPGKALKTIKGKPVLAYIIERVLQVFNREDIVLATSNQSSDDPIAAFASKQNINCYRGSLDNVSRRFYNAARTLDCAYAVRMNGDNIFLDQTTLKELKLKAEEGRHQFLSNVKNRTYPKGMSVEIVELDYFNKWLPTIEADKNYMEHVLFYLYGREKEDQHYYLMNTTLPEASGIQLALDTKEDFDRSAWMIEKMDKPHTKYGLKEIMKLYNEYEERT